MADTVVDQYWCHMCGRMVNPVMEPEIKCPICEGGFVEEVSSNNNNTTTITNINNDSNQNGNGNNGNELDVESERAFSLWAPILLGLMDGLGAYRPTLTLPSNATNEEAPTNEQHQLDREFESLLRRRRTRSSVSILRLLHDIRVRAETNHANNHSQENDDGSQSRDSRNNRLILVDPFNEGALILHGPTESARPETIAARSITDYLISPGLDLLLQHLAENDPNRYGTPPTQKEAVTAMPTIKVDDNLQCAVCLEDFELGSEAKEMPCKHKFHEACIHPWLDLHSSCPVCRFQMPTTDESKTEPNGGDASGGGGDSDINSSSGERRQQYRFPFPFNASLSFTRTPSGIGSTSSPSSSSDSSRIVHMLGDSSSHSDEPGGGGQELP
ncbi:E3 ubiquitin-protein ligase SIRP1 [Linum perenne]